jgi:peptidoglycan/LPS O-acetylase OafA/YrhL
MCAAQARWRLGHRPALDGLRGVAVLSVLADHGGFLPEPTGGIGVALFFVLSGFLITRVIVEARDDGAWSLGRFLANRFFRLFPALLLMVAVVSVLLLARGYSPAGVAERAAPPLTYVQNMFRPLSLPVFGHTWSLGVEEQFYLLWPLVLPWFAARARPGLVLGLAVAASATAMVVLPRDWLPMHAYALLTGCALALLGLPRGRWLLPVGALAYVGAIAVSPAYHQIYVYGPMTATPAAALLVAGACQGNRWLELPALRYVGRISYALYLWHVPLLRLTGTTYAGAAALLPLAAAVLIASASTLLLEEPVRRAWRLRRTRTDRVGGPRRQPAAP